MKLVDMIKAFELEINKLDDLFNKPVTDDTLYWLNQAVAKFVKSRFNGNAPKRTSYEQNEKRYKDLINLYEEKDDYQIPSPKEHASYDSYEFEYPDNMMFTLSEDVVISDMCGCHKQDTCVFECTADSFMYRVTNKLTDFHYRFHRARPLRVRTQDGCRLLTDKNYKIHSYSLAYLRVPEEIKVPETINNQSLNYEYKDFEDYIWLEIIKIAAQMYIENKGEQRYSTISNEVITQE